MPFSSYIKTKTQGLVMNYTAKNNYLDRIFYRSCLESSPRPVAPHRGTFPPAVRSDCRTQSQLHLLKQKLLHTALEEANEVGLFKSICGAANQAAELAWNAPFPLLVFPCLFEELFQIAREQFQPEQVWQTDESPWPPTEDENTGRNGGHLRRMLSMPLATG
jgi:hypothetical protein